VIIKGTLVSATRKSLIFTVFPFEMSNKGQVIEKLNYSLFSGILERFYAMKLFGKI
jgi:hypothetical protein